MFLELTGLAVLLVSDLASLGRELGWSPAPVLCLIGAGYLTGLGLIATVIRGAVKLARCLSIEWVMVAIILAMLPIPYYCIVSFPIGIWALIVLRRPEGCR